MTLWEETLPAGSCSLAPTKNGHNTICTHAAPLKSGVDCGIKVITGVPGETQSQLCSQSPGAALHCGEYCLTR